MLTSPVLDGKACLVAQIRGDRPARRTSPTTSRRHVAVLLTRAREEAGETQLSASSKFGWSIRKQQNLEAGDQVVSDRDLEQVLPALQIPEDDWPTWHELAEQARRKGWWDRYDASDLSVEAKRFIGLEQGATRIRHFEPLIVHGLLQTPEYRRATVVATSPAPRPTEQLEAMLEVSQRRQEVLDGPDPLELWAVLDEAALHRSPGGPKVLADQLHHLIRVAESHDNVTLQVIPYDAGMHPGLHGSFTLLEFGLPRDPGLVFVEATFDRHTYLSERSAVYAYAQVFEHLDRLALTPAQSLQMLRDVAGR
jgi:transcriptional regulator with XRE-family HTH domain